MEFVRVMRRLPASCDWQRCAFSRMELHIPTAFPLGEPVEVFLQPGMVLCAGHNVIHCRVICEESCQRLKLLREVVDVCEEQTRT